MRWLPVLLLLGGCATTSEPEVNPVPVTIPIEVACVEVTEIPDRPEIASLTRESLPGEKIEAIVIHRERLITHADELESLLVSCSQTDSRQQDD